MCQISVLGWSGRPTSCSGQSPLRHDDGFTAWVVVGVFGCGQPTANVVATGVVSGGAGVKPTLWSGGSVVSSTLVTVECSYLSAATHNSASLFSQVRSISKRKYPNTSVQAVCTPTLWG